MTSRERVFRCLSFDNPDRIPMGLPAPYPNDIVWGGISPDPDWKPFRTWDVDDGAQWEDEWHNVWRRFANTTRGEVIEGALKDWDDLPNYAFPRFEEQSRYAEARRVFLADPDRYHLGNLPGFPFAIMRYLRQMEIFLADVLLYPDKVLRLQQRVVDMLKKCISEWSDVGADGVIFAEDWGTQERLLVSPALWEKMFRPGYEDIVGYAKTKGVYIWMHSCGYIRDIIPSLRDIGVSVLQLDQPTLSGIDWLRETVGGKVTIWSPVDIQKILPTGERDLIRTAAKEMIQTLGASGGFIAGHYADMPSIMVESQWQEWANEAFVEFGDLSNADKARQTHVTAP